MTVFKVLNKYITKLNCLAFVALLGFSSITSATVIEINGTRLNPIEIDESFRTFYRYADPTPYSANTGYELANTFTMFFAKHADDLALFMIFSGPDGDAGGVNFDIDGDGELIYLDDPVRREPGTGRIIERDPIVGNNVSLNYVAGYTDGLIYGGSIESNWSLNINFNDSYGLDGYRMLSFDRNGGYTIADSGSNMPSAIYTTITNTSQVPVPYLGGLFVVALALLTVRTRVNHSKAAI